MNTVKRQGWYPGKNTFDTFLFRFDRIVAQRRVEDAIRVKESSNKDKKKIFTTKFSSPGYDFFYPRGRVKRPTFSFVGILATRKVEDDFSAYYIRSRLFEKRYRCCFFTTDCPLNTNGILKNVLTGYIPIVSLVKGKGELKTLWEVFGEDDNV